MCAYYIIQSVEPIIIKMKTANKKKSSLFMQPPPFENRAQLQDT